MKAIKKALSFLLSFALIFSICGTSVFAEGIIEEDFFTENLGSYSGTCGENLSWVLDSAGTLTISGTGDMYDYPFNNAPWYSMNSQIYSVVVENDVTSIGEGAFHNCDNIVSALVGESVATIGAKAFSFCYYLENVTLPNSLITIGDYAFEDCEYLESILIPNSVITIGNYAFSDCNYLYDVNLGSSVETIGHNAFSWCGYLETITIPASVTSIGERAFYECEYLYEINVEEDNQYYSSEDGVLFNKDKTSLICYPQYKWEESYLIPESVVSIENYAFYYCQFLNEITIGNSVTHIGTDAFYRTGYYDTSSNWNAGVLYLGDYLISAENGKIFRDYVVKDGTKVIADNAFWLCEYLITVEVPSSVIAIGNNAFYSCTALVEVNVAEDNPNYSSTEGILFNKEQTELVCFPANKQMTSYTIPESVKTIGDYSFGYCTTLSQIIIGDFVDHIGDFAFSYCEKLNSITIPASVVYLGHDAFSNCSALTEATIDASINKIEQSTFYYCTALLEISLPNTITSIGDTAFYQCLALTAIDIPDSVTSIGELAFYYCPNLSSVKISDSLEFVGQEAFYWCQNLLSITLPESIITIKGRAFGHYHDWDINGNLTIENFTITGVKGSEAERYAAENGLAFISIAPSLPGKDSNIYMDSTSGLMPNVTANSKASDIISELSSYNISVTITNANGDTLDTADLIGTGCKVLASDGTEYTVIVCGDVDGTGNVNSTDYLRIKSLFLGQLTLDQPYLIAADADGSGSINSTDYFRIKSCFLGTFDLYA